jgi:hypothetical protein
MYEKSVYFDFKMYTSLVIKSNQKKFWPKKLIYVTSKLLLE